MNEYVINCKGIMFVEYSLEEAVEVLNFHGSFGDCIIFNDKLLTTYEEQVYGISPEEAIAMIMQKNLKIVEED